MAKNVHKVPLKMWQRQWDKNAQAMFNRLWDELDIANCFPEGHPSQKDKKMLSVLRWNVCVMAACCMQRWRGNWGNDDMPRYK